MNNKDFKVFLHTTNMRDDLEPYVKLSERNYPSVYLDIPSFLGSKVAKDKKDMRDCEICFLGIPWEGANTWGSWSGCILTPMYVRKNSLRYYGGFIPELNVKVPSKFKICDCGDVVVDMQSRAVTFENIERKIGEILDAKSVPIIMGGDHSITVPIIKAMLEKGKNPLILHFDAHYDNAPSYLGDEYARACPIRRIVDDLGVPPQNVIQLGIRGPRNSPAGKDYADEMGIKVYDIWHLKREGFDEVIKEIRKRAEKTDGVYITICMDVLDSSVAPAAAGDPLGLTSHELIDALMRIVSQTKLLGMDIVEIYPPLDIRDMTTHLAIWIILYTLAAMQK